jgi:hypothetical protein
MIIITITYNNNITYYNDLIMMMIQSCFSDLLGSTGGLVKSSCEEMKGIISSLQIFYKYLCTV